VDFFQAQDSARTRTRALVALFTAAVLAIIVAIYAVVHVVLGPGAAGPIDPVLLLIVAALTTGLVTAGSTVRTMQLRQGGPRVAELLGGRRVQPDSTDEAERRLVNVVEEMAIASGTPVPAIYVLEHESGINAFAAGYTLDDAAVAVTRGTLDSLSRDELQGVIAHEFSHILNGDMRINIRLMGLLFGILLLAIVGRGLLHSGARGGRGRRGSGGQVAVVGLALVLVGYIGVFFGKLIQAAVSRQREFLADAAAVQFTRDPEGIGGALRKIGATTSRIEDHHAQEAGHLFFANGVGSALTSLLATHPPLNERIRRLDPAFTGRPAAEPGARTPAAAAATATARMAAEPAAAAGIGRGFTGSAGAQTPATLDPATAAHSAGRAEGKGPATPRPIASAALLASIGAPQPQHVAYARRLLEALPPGIRDAAHDGEGAAALLFALLLHGAGTARQTQQTALRQLGGDALVTRVAEMADDVRSAGPAARLPLLDLLLPALRQLSQERQRQVRAVAEQLTAADGRTDFFEFALLHVVQRQLAGGTERPSPPRAARLEVLRDDLEYVLSATAWGGGGTEAEAAAAFDAGAHALQPQLRELRLHASAEMKPARLGEALERVRGGTPGIRRRVLEACTLAVAHDGVVHTQETELLRAVAEAIDLPLPPSA
jgi:Zn-dependent protease with chaperone function